MFMRALADQPNLDVGKSGIKPSVGSIVLHSTTGGACTGLLLPRHENGAVRFVHAND